MDKDSIRLFIDSIFYNRSIIPSIHFLFDKDSREKIIDVLDNEYSGSSKKHIIKEEIIPEKIYDDGFYINVKNSDLFFSKLSSLYKGISALYDEKTCTSTDVDIIVPYLWLRATNEDFNDIESFLDREIQMLSNDEVSFFNEEQEIGKVPFLNHKELRVENTLANYYDENTYQMVFRLYSDSEIPDSILPVVRYGIYERNGKKICLIGSVQNKSENVDKETERAKYKINDGINVTSELLDSEPKKVISMLLFIAIMKENGISDFEIRGLGVLNDKYHNLLSEQKHDLFLQMYSDGERPKDTDDIYYYDYDFYKKQHDAYYGKQDIINEMKTGKLYGLVDRILYHYPDSSVSAYPGDVDSNMHFSVNSIELDSINGKYVKELISGIKDLSIDLDYSINDTFVGGEVELFDINKLKELSKHRSGLASYIIGLSYEYGIFGLEQDSLKAKSYFQRGSAVGDLRCSYQLTDSYREGNNVIRRINENKSSDFLENTFNNITTILFAVEEQDVSMKEVLDKVDGNKNKLYGMVLRPIFESIKKIRKDSSDSLDDIVKVTK